METTNQEVMDMVDRFQGMLSHIGNTFIRGTELAAKVDALEARVTELVAKVDEYVQLIAAQNDTIANITQQRNEAQNSLAQEQQEHNVTRSERDTYRFERDNARTDLDRVKEELSTTNRDFDSAKEAWREEVNGHNDTKARLEEVTRERDEGHEINEGLAKENEEMKAHILAIEQKLKEVSALFEPKREEVPQTPRIVGYGY